MSADYLTELKRAVEVSHGCTATYAGTVPVREVFRGSVVWEGEVEVFDISGHPKAGRCFAWGVPEDSGKPGQIEATTVLEIPPVTSPISAVRAAIVAKAQRG